MFFKIALGNMKKSLRDYVVYFLTLTLGVCIFYVFNAVDTQASMLEIANSGYSAADMLVIAIGVVSVFVSFVLAFLILYANNFMIKRRKKELGIYMTLGMSKNRIAGMLLLETAIMGLIALAVGLLLGVFLSQGLSFVTAKLFDVIIVNYQFVFSPAAFYKTIIYFGIIFIVAMLFNSASISKYQLIDLLYAERKNEELKTRKLWVCIVCLVLAILLIGASYYMVIRLGVMVFTGMLAVAVALCGVGTLFLLMAISGFLLRGAGRNKKLYYKELNMFSLRQFFSKINTNFVSMTFICMMLFLTMVILSTVTSFNTAFNEEVDKTTPFDVSYRVNEAPGERDDMVIADQLPGLGIDENELFSQWHEFNVYETGVRMLEVVEPVTEFLTDESAVQRVNEQTMEAVSLSDYNAVVAMQGGKPLQLPEGGFAIITLAKALEEKLAAFMENPAPLTVAGTQITLAHGEILKDSLWADQSSTSDLYLVVPDDVAGALPPNKSVYVADYNPAGSPDVQQYLYTLRPNFDAFANTTGVRISAMYSDETRMQNASLTTTAIFVGIYLGMVFLIAAAAVLALQQLSSAADNRERYMLLRKLGAEERMVNKSLLLQVLLYFALPLVFALMHAVVGMGVMNQGIAMFGKVDVTLSSALAAAFMAVIYGGYFFATYAGCKNIIAPPKRA